MFELTCNRIQVSPSGPLILFCSATGGEIASSVCNYDDGALIDVCKNNIHLISSLRDVLTRNDCKQILNALKGDDLGTRLSY